MGEDGFSIEEAYRTVSKTGPIETYKRDMNKVGPGQYWMYTEEYFYPRQCEFAKKLVVVYPRLLFPFSQVVFTKSA